MIKLTIDNSECIITGLNVSQFKQLKEILSYDIDDQATYFSRAFSSKRYLLGKRGEFPTGLLYLVIEHLDKGNYEYDMVDIRKSPSNPCKFDFKPDFPPYSEQVLAAEACRRHRRGIVVAPTGVGKSLIAGLIIQQLQCRTLVVVPTLELKRQLTESLRKGFGASRVGPLTKNPDIVVENYDALKMTELKGYDAVIIDEFHHSGARTYRQLNKKSWKNIYYKLGLTATPFRSNDNERLLLESVLSKVIYRLTYQEAVAKSYIVPVEAYYITLPRIPVKGHTWAQVYKELVVGRKDRNNIIAALMKDIHAGGKSALTLVKEIAHGQALADLTGSAFANGQDEDTPMFINGFNSKALRSLIGTVGVLGEGVDTKPAEFVIIAGLGKAKSQFMQQVGRAVRMYPGKESAKIIIFKDPSHKFTVKHFNAQVRHLKEEYGVVAVQL